MINEKCEILKHEELLAGYRLLVVKAPEMAPSLVPGQFVHVKVPALEASALRRPFSVFDAEDGKVSILYKTVGRGTAALNAAKVGDTLEIIGPLGHGFPIECSGTAFLVGGGFGVAPLYFLAKRMIASGHKGRIALFAGGRTKDDLLAIDDFKALGVEVYLATNDGSAGEKGLVTVPLDDQIVKHLESGENFEFFACGPDPMLKAIAIKAVGLKKKGWISMDRHMICGVGACYACIQKTVRGNSRCCIEGPIFAAEDLVWEDAK